MDKLQALGTRVKSILRSATCFSICFRLDNIAIQTHMYSAIAGEVELGGIHLKIDGRGYDPTSDTLTMDTDDPEPAVVVHEATHAAIDAYHLGLNVTLGTHEAPAYLGETLYWKYGGQRTSIDVMALARPLSLLADKVKFFNDAHRSGLFTCLQGDVVEIQQILKFSALRMSIDRVYRMNGLSRWKL